MAISALFWSAERAIAFAIAVDTVRPASTALGGLSWRPVTLPLVEAPQK